MVHSFIYSFHAHLQGDITSPESKKKDVRLPNRSKSIDSVSSPPPVMVQPPGNPLDVGKYHRPFMVHFSIAIRYFSRGALQNGVFFGARVGIRQMVELSKPSCVYCKG